MTDEPSAPEQMLEDAFRHLQSAIDLLDAAEAPGTIATHADLAARRLEELIGKGGAATVIGAEPVPDPWRATATS
jgi:hypothetical protein